MKKEGIWLNLEGTRQVKLGWNDIWKIEPYRQRLKRFATWGLKVDAKCELCGKPANLEKYYPHVQRL